MRYSDAVLDRVRRPTRVGALPGDAPDVGTGEAGTLDEGTVTRISVRVAEGRVTEACFKVFGCSAAVASASLVAERLEGAAIAEGARLAAEDIVDALSLPAERTHAARLAVAAAQDAIGDWQAKQERQAAKGE